MFIRHGEDIPLADRYGDAVMVQSQVRATLQPRLFSLLFPSFPDSRRYSICIAVSKCTDTFIQLPPTTTTTISVSFSKCRFQGQSGRVWTRVHDLTPALAGQTVLVRARLHAVRGKGKSAFLVLRQRTDTVQVGFDGK